MRNGRGKISVARALQHADRLPCDLLIHPAQQANALLRAALKYAAHIAGQRVRLLRVQIPQSVIVLFPQEGRGLPAGLFPNSFRIHGAKNAPFPAFYSFLSIMPALSSVFSRSLCSTAV